MGYEIPRLFYSNGACKCQPIRTICLYKISFLYLAELVLILYSAVLCHLVGNRLKVALSSG